jgi:raffinose/stachyose/melibiose transport system permease protein
VIVLFTLFILYPFFSLGLQFFGSGSSLLKTWKTGNFTRLLMNSFFYSIVTAVSSSLLGLMAGFALSKLSRKSGGALRVFFYFGIFFALQSVLVPLFLGIKAAGLYNSRLGVLIPCLGLGIPPGVCLGTEFIKSIPDAVVESARLDGAGYFRIFRNIILPMSYPAAGLIGALVFVIIWNEYLVISVLANSSGAAASLNLALPALAAGSGGAASVLVPGLAPSIVIFLLLRKQFVRVAGMIRG